MSVNQWCCSSPVDLAASRWCRYTLALCAWVIIAAPSMSLAAGYTFTTIDCSDGSTVGLGINSNGDIVGSYQRELVWRGFRFDGTMCTPLNPPDSTFTYVAGINDAGLVSGYFNRPQDDQGFLYDGDTFETFRCNGRHTDAFAIRSDGTIVGGSETSWGFETRAFLRTPSGSCSEFFGSPTVLWAQAHDINAVGQIVGRFHQTGALLTHGFTRFPDGSQMQIDYPGIDDNTEAWGINSFGQIVGAYKDIAGIWHGYLKDGDAYTTIDVPGDMIRDTHWIKINDSGVMVGYFMASSDRMHGVVATPQ